MPLQRQLEQNPPRFFNEISNRVLQFDNSREPTSYSIKSNISNIVNKIYSNFQKTRKVEMYQDKESLFDDALKLNQNLNTLKIENNELKKMNESVENDLAQKDIIIENLCESIQESDILYNRSNNPHLVMELRRQIKAIRSENKEKDDKIDILERNKKYTNMIEFHLYFQAIKDEHIRLNHKVDELVKNKKNLFGGEINDIEVKINELEKTERNLKKIVAKLRRGNKDKDNEIIWFKNKREEQQDKIQKLIKSHKEIKTIKNENAELKKQLNEVKKANIFSLKHIGKKTTQLSTKSKGLPASQKYSNRDDADSIFELRKLESKYEEEIQQINLKHNEEKIKIQNSTIKDLLEHITEKEKKEIKYKLIISQIDSKGIINKIEKMGGKVLSLGKLSEILKENPFNLKLEVINSMIFYLKKNYSKKELFTPGEISDVFFKLIGNFSLFDENTIIKEINNVSIKRNFLKSNQSLK